MNKRRRWILFIVLIGLTGLVVASWSTFILWRQQFKLQQYTSPPIDSKGTRVSVLAPVGWEASLQNRAHIQNSVGIATPKYTLNVHQVHKPNSFMHWLETTFPSTFNPNLAQIEAYGVGVQVDIYLASAEELLPLKGTLVGKEILSPEPNWTRSGNGPTVYYWVSTRSVSAMGYHAVLSYGYPDKEKFDSLHKAIAESLTIVNGT